VQELSRAPKLKVLKHMPARWLSMKACLERLLLRIPWKQFFSIQKSAQKGLTATTGVKRAYDFLSSHSAICYSHFLVFSMEIFEKTNMAPQVEKPMIHKLRPVLHELYAFLLRKFVKP